MVKNRILIISVSILVSLLFVSCAAHQPIVFPFGDKPGFWTGFWHGLIAPISFIISLFNEHVRIYNYPNVGRWYDFGFMLGIGGFTGGIFAGSRKRS